MSDLYVDAVDARYETHRICVDVTAGCALRRGASAMQKPSLARPTHSTRVGRQRVSGLSPPLWPCSGPWACASRHRGFKYLGFRAWGARAFWGLNERELLVWIVSCWLDFEDLRVDYTHWGRFGCSIYSP